MKLNVNKQRVFSILGIIGAAITIAWVILMGVHAIRYPKLTQVEVLLWSLPWGAVGLPFILAVMAAECFTRGDKE